MEMNLSTSEREALHKLQRNLCGSFDYACVACLLMLDKDYKPSAVSECLGIDISTVYRYRSSYLYKDVWELLDNHHKSYWGIIFKEELEALLTLNFRLCNSQSISF